MKALTFILASALLAATASHRDQDHSVAPLGGFVPDSVTAARIAEAVWTPIYGAAAIRRQRPLAAKLVDSTWIVTGTLPKNTLGGVALIEIAKRDARILRVSHGR